MVVVSHLFFFFDKKFGESVTRYESHPPSLRTVYFPTAPCQNDEKDVDLVLLITQSIA